MARPAVIFTLGTQSTGTAAEGNDHIMGTCLYGTAPGSFGTTAYQAVFGVPDAEAKGITLDYADETKATASLVISSVGSTGDVLKIEIVEKVPITNDFPTGTKTTTLCEYTQVAGDTTPTLLAVSVAAAINARTYLTATPTLTGYTATSSSGTITFTARTGLGVNLNTVSVTTTVTGTISLGTNTAFSGGVYSKKAIWHYLVSEFFRGNANGVYWLGFFSSPDYTADVITLKNASDGTIGVCGVFDVTATSAATLSSNGTLLQVQAATSFTDYTPLDIIYAPNIKAISDLSTLQNQQSKSNYNISPAILQDGAGAGAQLYLNSGVSITNIGIVLGTLSKCKVNQDVGEGIFNITDDTEMAVPAFANGTRCKSLAASLLDQLDTYRYLFATNQPNISGTFIVNDWSAVNTTSPYNRISRTRTMNKAVRLLYAALAPKLKSQVELNEDGTLSEDTIAIFESCIVPVQTQMKNAKELSNMRVTIDASQKITETGKLIIGVAIQPTITADFIEVQMSFVAKIS